MNARTFDPEAETQTQAIVGAFKKFGPLSIKGVVAATGTVDRYARMVVERMVSVGSLKLVGVGAAKEQSIYALTGKDLTAAEFSLNPDGQVRMTKLGRSIELEPQEARKLLQFLTRTEDVWFPPEATP